MVEQLTNYSVCLIYIPNNVFLLHCIVFYSQFFVQKRYEQ